MKIKSTLLVLDGKINANGHGYVKESFKKTPKEVPIYLTSQFNTNIVDAIGKAKIDIKDDRLIASGEIWDDYAIMILKDHRIPIFISSMGNGNTNDKGIVENYEIEAAFLNITGNSDERTGIIEVLNNE